MLRRQQTLLRAARLGAAQAATLEQAIGSAWRAHSSQAAPADIPAGPVLPPFDYVPPKYTGPSKEEVLALRKQYLSPGKGNVAPADRRRGQRHTRQLPALAG